MPTQTTIGKTTLRLVVGDIAEQDTDAVVTAAHWRLNKGMGTDGTIHSKGGPKIYEECQRIGGCPIGDAVITTGGNLKARHVIHAVGQSGAAVMSTSQSCWRAPIAGVCRSQRSTACAVSRFHPYPPERLFILSASQHRSRSGRSSSSWSESSTASTRCGWFSTLARMTPPTRYLHTHLSRYFQRGSQMERPNKKRNVANWK